MIQPLRTTHRLVFLVWLVLLPAVFAAGLRSRPPRSAPAPERSGVASGDLVVSEKTQVIDSGKFRMRILRNPNQPNEREIAFIAEKPLVSPDVLLYWTARPPGRDLPVDARLLGPYQPDQRYRLPSEISGKGYILLYSLAHQEALGSLSLEEQP